MISDWEPSDPEHAAMARFLQREGTVISDAGSYPLLTYSSHYKQKHELPASDEELQELEHNGDHLRTAVMAARLGIPVRQWSHKVINLTCPDLLKGDDWLAGWNGVWIHRSHGAGGICDISGPLKDGSYTVKRCSGYVFYVLYAKFILNRSAFRHGVLCVCQSVRSTDDTGRHCTPFIVELKETCRELGGGDVTLYGARGEIWVPLYGPHAGKMLLAPEPFIFGRDRGLYLTDQGKRGKGDLLTFVSKERELEVCGMFSEAYYLRAAFDPDHTVTLEDRQIDPRPIHWYRI